MDELPNSAVEKPFLQRLRERKLVQWTLAYVATTFALIQVLDVVFQRFGWPEQIERLLIVAMAAGFFVMLVLAWYHGEKGAQKVTSRELGVLVVVLAISGGVLWHFERATSPDDVAMRFASPVRAVPTTVQSQSSPAPAKSIAVLPFINESDDRDQQYFSDGLSEDLIVALSQFEGLKVISRNSAFQFRNSRLSSDALGRALGVAHLLEGSVRRQGDKVRVSAELVNAVDGRTLWSQNYDRPYTDLFALQDAITNQVAGAMKAKLLDGGGAVVQSDRPPSGNLDAYSAYLKGLAKFHLNNEAALRAAIGQFNEAARIDPRYAAAYASSANAWIQLGAYYLGSEAKQQAYSSGRAAAEHALELDPMLAVAHNARGKFALWAAFDWKVAEAEYRRALQLAPHDAEAKYGLGIVQGALGHSRQAIALLEQAIADDPRNSDANFWLGANLAGVGEMDKAERVLRAAIKRVPDDDALYMGLALVLVERGQSQAALVVARKAGSDTYIDVAMALALQLGQDKTAANAALQVLIAKHADNSAYQIADVYALRRDADKTFEWLDRAWDNRDPGISWLLFDPIILRFRDDPRFAAFCNKVGLPTATEAKAMP